MKRFLIGFLGMVFFVGVFYVITLGQHHEHARAGAQFETFYDTATLHAARAQRVFYTCRDDVRIAFDRDIRRVSVFLDPENYAVVDVAHHVSLPGGEQYRSETDSFTINDDGTSFVIVEGSRIASQCVREEA